MAKKSIEGQLDMFELFDSVEELEERIKGVPEPREASAEEKEPEQEASAENRWVPSGEPVMQKSFRRGDAAATVAYLDYNMVYVAGWEGEPALWQFEQSKDAVGFYVEQLETFAAEKQVRVSKEREALREARVIKWTGEVEG